MANIKWTNEREQELLDLLEEGKTFEECAEIFESTKSAIRNRAAIVRSVKEDDDKPKEGYFNIDEYGESVII
jgi:Zn-dependent M32 family carboxypeptidase